ncbi:hypothetical protein BGZ61DRAFT_71972 [Ilyonectria robusta]|uniref:uncharacterized protein n=1 Tax=Ilyonectria robusta TaxID=1079257 RepID=UPI001E8CA45F|nr:uncharacterized protein BGZ61DRAFT_71972 [Ilyonectria robusta]KAH8676940.1 hypothetical protein BGZ61DRAFT_71972 [Ilyonectria robusta]
MKYNTIAFAPLLAAVADATSLLSLGIDISLPGGLSLPDESVGPTGEPRADCINVWHPPHHGVDIDDCDNDSDEHWHYVHPGTKYPEQEQYAWTTKTVHATKIHTVTDCPAYVTDCPSHHTYVTTVEVPATTTICPVPVKEVYEAPTTKDMYEVPTTKPMYEEVPTTKPMYEEVPTTEAEYEVPSITMSYEKPEETSTSCPPGETTEMYPPPTTKVYKVSSVTHPYMKPETTSRPPGEETYPVPARSSTSWIPNVPEYTTPAVMTPGYVPPAAGTHPMVCPGPGCPSKSVPGYAPPAVGTSSMVCPGPGCPPYPTDVPTTIIPVVPEMPTEGMPTPTPTMPVVVGGAVRNAGGLFAAIAAVAAALV